ncbi:hypothetical protein FOZ63_009048 [Perkinsus olseni]|uniref:Uncharacterized protein n=1 Tax=Perkinsus olseni TaxID=32597 RepID=A0A7J6N697_PEROL|nr:hypothetical protein FOZ63_009048 [Perkinsus olseni]
MPVETLLNGTRITTYDTCAGPWHGWSYCEAYADFLRSGKPDAGFVLFLNGNFSVEYVELVIRSIQAGTFHARFAYLGEGRQLKTAEADVCGMPTGERLAGYDGGLFVARNDALQSVVSSGIPSCDCDSLDRVWHVLFGQPEEYPRISESLEIPMGLRLKYLDTHTRESWLDAELGPVVPSRPMPMPWEEDSDMDWGGGRIMDPL